MRIEQVGGQPRLELTTEEREALRKVLPVVRVVSELAPEILERLGTRGRP